MTHTTTEGGCLCGAIRYRLTGEPQATSLCHCQTCRHATGGPSVAWVVMRSSEVIFLRGHPLSFQSSPGVQRTFCGQCGTTLTYQRTAAPETLDMTIATLDAPNEFPPTREIWIEEKLSWEWLNESLPHYSRSSVGNRPIGKS